jgi:hypothetical protein
MTGIMSDATEGGAALYLMGAIEAAAAARPSRAVGEVLSEAIDLLRGQGYEWSSLDWLRANEHKITPDGWCAIHSTGAGPVYCAGT